MPHTCIIQKIKPITHNVKSFTLEKPTDYEFTPGQATEVAVNKKGMENEKRPFTFTSLPSAPNLEFTIKGYYDHDGVTKTIHNLQVGESLLLEDPWGTIEYKKPGVFIAGGAGITPFIAIFRNLHQQNKLAGNRLIFSNRTERDIILHEELKKLFDPSELDLVLTSEKKGGYAHGRIDSDYLADNIKDFDQAFYVCGPPPMVKDMRSSLQDLGAKVEEIVFEK